MKRLCKCSIVVGFLVTCILYSYFTVYVIHTMQKSIDQLELDYDIISGYVEDREDIYYQISLLEDHITSLVNDYSEMTDSSSIMEERISSLENEELFSYLDTLDKILSAIESKKNPVGEYTEEDYLLLATTIYCESGGSIEESIAIGCVILNRLYDKDTWADDTLMDVISREKQFSVYSESPDSKFQRVLRTIKEDTSDLASKAKIAAFCVLNGLQEYIIPTDVQFFCSYEYWLTVKGESGNWGVYPKYGQVGATVFFYKSN